MAEKKRLNIEEITAAVTKRFGKGSVFTLNGDSLESVPVIPTGSPSLDSALGVMGYPRGRIIELFGAESSGKTSLALLAVAQAQLAGGIVAYIDAEHALDPQHAQRIGVDIDSLLLSQPECAEDALNLVDFYLREHMVDLVVIDSVAALVPKVELEGAIGDSHMGLHARIMSQTMRKINASASDTDCAILFINQTRQKIGVVFGCFPRRTKVLFADGRRLEINNVVEKKIRGKVLSYDAMSNSIVECEIVNWYKDGVPIDEFKPTWVGRGAKSLKKRDFIKVIYAYPDNSGWGRVVATTNHPFLTDAGWKYAKDLTLTDSVKIIGNTLKFSDDVHQLILGSILGDASIRCNSKHLDKAPTAYLEETHSVSQAAYCKWKAEKLKNVGISFIGEDNRGNTLFRTYPSYALLEYGRKYYGSKTSKHFTTDILNLLSPLGLAVWYMDDGTISKNARNASICFGRNAFDDDPYALLVKFKERFGLSPKLYKKGKGEKYWYSIEFLGEEFDRFITIISPHIPKCMSYKLPNDVLYGEGIFDQSVIPMQEILSMPIKYLKQVSKMGKDSTVYNIEVTNNHNYMVNEGVIVHNSPETTTGGNALKFYSTIRLQVSRGKTLKVKEESVGIIINVKVVKNKVAPPFKKAEAYLFFNRGFDPVYECLNSWVDAGLVEKSGTWYSYKGESIGQGIPGVSEYFRNNPVALSEILSEHVKYRAELMDTEEDIDIDTE